MQSGLKICYKNYVLTVNTTATFSINTPAKPSFRQVFSRNPETLPLHYSKNPGFPIKTFGNDEKCRCSVKSRPLMNTRITCEYFFAYR